MMLSVTLPTLRKHRICGFYFVSLVVNNVQKSQAVFPEHANLHDLRTEETVWNFWAAINQGQPLKSALECEHIVQAIDHGPLTPQAFAECPKAQSTMHQGSTIFHNKAETFDARSASSFLPSLAQSDIASFKLIQPENQVEFMEYHDDPLAFYSYQISQNEVAPSAEALPDSRNHLLDTNTQRGAMALSPESLSVLKHHNDDLLSAIHNYNTSLGQHPPSHILEPLPGRFSAESMMHFQLGRSFVTMGTASEDQEREKDLVDSLAPEFQAQSSLTSSAHFQTSYGAPIASICEPGIQSINVRLPHLNVNKLSPTQQVKKINDVGHLKEIESELTSAHDTETDNPIDKPETIDQLRSKNSNKSTGCEDLQLARVQVQVNSIKEKLLDPVQHGFLESFKSFLKVLENPMVDSDSNTEGGVWIRENFARDFLNYWKNSKIPYPSPFENVLLRKNHVHKHFMSIASKVLDEQGFSQDISIFTQVLLKNMNKNMLKYGKLPFHVHKIYQKSGRSSNAEFKSKFGKGFSSKLKASSKGAIFLAGIINSIFLEAESNPLDRKGEEGEIWKFIKSFWTELNYFEPELQQGYHWLCSSDPLSGHIQGILENVRRNIVRSNEIHEAFYLSVVLTEAWLSEKRPMLYKALTQNGGRIDKRFQSILNKFITYICPKVSAALHVA